MIAMMSESELDAYVTRLIDSESKEMVELVGKGGAIHGRKAEQTEVMGVVAECGRTGCVSGENIHGH